MKESLLPSHPKPAPFPGDDCCQQLGVCSRRSFSTHEAQKGKWIWVDAWLPHCTKWHWTCSASPKGQVQRTSWRFALGISMSFRMEEFICLPFDGVQSEDGWLNKHGELEFPWRHPGGSSHPLHHNWKDLAHYPVHISNACSGCSSWGCLEWRAVWLHL